LSAPDPTNSSTHKTKKCGGCCRYTSAHTANGIKRNCSNCSPNFSSSELPTGHERGCDTRT